MIVIGSLTIPNEPCPSVSGISFIPPIRLIASSFLGHILGSRFLTSFRNSVSDSKTLFHRFCLAVIFCVLLFCVVDAVVAVECASFVIATVFDGSGGGDFILLTGGGNDGDNLKLAESRTVAINTEEPISG